jgi:hypothetical protein
VVTTQLTIDAVRNELRWTSTTTGAPNTITAVVLRRRGGGTISGVASSTSGAAPTVARMTIPDSSTRVVARLLGPGARTASGVLPLTRADREAFAASRLSLAVYPAKGDAVEQLVKR